MFAVAGFLFALPAFRETFLCLPGLLVLLIFMDMWVIGHGGILFVVATNPIAYGVVGFLIGTFLPLGRRTMFVLAGCVGTVWLGGIGWHYGPGWIRQLQLNHRVEEAKKRLRVDPNDIYALDQMGRYYSITGSDFEAAEYYRKVVDLQSGADKLSYEAQASLLSLAIIHQSRGEHAVADGYHARFLASEPALERYQVLRHNNTFYLNQRAAAQKSGIPDSGVSRGRE